LLHALFNNIFDCLIGIQFRFLRQHPEGYALLAGNFAEVVLIFAGNDAQQGTFTGAVITQHADFGTVEKREIDVVQYTLIRLVDFAHSNHRKNYFLITHGYSIKNEELGMKNSL